MIKSLIFDQDGTFYPKNHQLILEIRKKTKNWIGKRLKKSIDEIDNLYKMLPKRYPNPLEGFLSLGLNIKEYFYEVFDKTNPSNFLKKDNKLIEMLSDIKQKKFVVTIASKKYSIKLQRALGIDKLIDYTFSSEEYYKKDLSKIYIYEIIRKKLKLRPSDICVIGDNIEVDLLPAIKKGYKGILVGNDSKDKRIISCKSIYEIKKAINYSNSFILLKGDRN